MKKKLNNVQGAKNSNAVRNQRLKNLNRALEDLKIRAPKTDKGKTFQIVMYEWSKEGYKTLMEMLGINDFSLACNIADMLDEAHRAGMEEAYNKCVRDSKEAYNISSTNI